MSSLFRSIRFMALQAAVSAMAIAPRQMTVREVDSPFQGRVSAKKSGGFSPAAKLMQRARQERIAEHNYRAHQRAFR